MSLLWIFEEKIKLAVNLSLTVFLRSSNSGGSSFCLKSVTLKGFGVSVGYAVRSNVKFSVGTPIRVS